MSIDDIRAAQRKLAASEAQKRTNALQYLSQLLVERQQDILEHNQRDVEQASQDQIGDVLINRLKLSPQKIEALRQGCLQLAQATDPLGSRRVHRELDHGLVLEQRTSPIGVLLVIFESRPDAVIQIGSLAIRSGNAVVLKGGREAKHSNALLVSLLQEALTKASLNAEAVMAIEGREEVDALLDRDDVIDLVIPRGSNALVRSIQQRSRIPVLGHAAGVCHVYVDEEADIDMASRILFDSRCDYPSACNAVETILVHASQLPHLERLCAPLQQAGVEIRGDASICKHLPWAVKASESDWGTEYGDLIVAMRSVETMDDAIDHIHTYGSAHTECIVTQNEHVASRFLQTVDAASVFHNASTRFADGYRYGLGAEVGISTSRIHARGPVGIEGLLTTRWLLHGSGQVAADYGFGKAKFTHRDL